jgi:hypothetical protein
MFVVFTSDASVTMQGTLTPEVESDFLWCIPHYMGQGAGQHFRIRGTFHAVVDRSWNTILSLYLLNTKATNTRAFLSFGPSLNRQLSPSSSAHVMQIKTKGEI